MPIKNGIQVVQEIRKIYKHINKVDRKRFKLLPPRVILLTAFKTPNF